MIFYLWALISLGSKGKAASETSLSSAPLPLFRSLFSSLRYIFIICFSCSDWMVTWQPYMGLVISTFWLISGGNTHTHTHLVNRQQQRSTALLWWMLDVKITPDIVILTKMNNSNRNITLTDTCANTMSPMSRPPNAKRNRPRNVAFTWEENLNNILQNAARSSDLQVTLTCS